MQSVRKNTPDIHIDVKISKNSQKKLKSLKIVKDQ